MGGCVYLCSIQKQNPVWKVATSEKARTSPKAAFEPDVAALKGRKPACHFKGVYFTVGAFNSISESKQEKGADSVLIYNSTRQLCSSCSLWSDICKTNKTHERVIPIRM